MNWYSLLLFLHSNLRWLPLILAVVVIVRGFAAWRSKRAWGKLDNALHAATVGIYDLMLLVGIALYAVSPIIRALFQDVGAGMKDPMIRFFGVEHATLMVLAIAVLHVGRVLSKKAKSDAARHRRVWMWTLAALLLTLAAIPWPGMRQPRPLFRPVPQVSMGSGGPMIDAAHPGFALQPSRVDAFAA